MMDQVILTGATGFLGRWLTRMCLSEGIEVVAVIRPGSKNRALLPEGNGLTVVECEMGDYIRLPQLIFPQGDSVFYHLAWEGVSGPARSDPAVQMNNVLAACGAVEAAAQLGCRAFVGLGTIMEAESAAVTEADGSKPGMGYVYGGAKWYAHLSTKALASERGIDHVWPMLTNAYGPHEFSPRFINSTMRKMLEHQSLEFTAGTQNYDFIYVEDVARALLAVGAKGKSGHQYVIGSGHPAPLRTFVERMGKALAPDQQLHFGNVPYTGVQLPLSAFSTETLERDTGFIPQVPFEEGLAATMEWLKDRN